MKTPITETVYGHCKHGHSMVTCDVCNPKEVSEIQITEEDKEKIDKAFKKLKQNERE